MREFDTSESMKNAGILDVFPIFCTAIGAKDSPKPAVPIVRCCLRNYKAVSIASLRFLTL